MSKSQNALEFRPWQRDLVKDFTLRKLEYKTSGQWTYDSRKINIIVTDKKSIGISFLRNYCKKAKLAVGIPIVHGYKDIMNFAFRLDKYEGYIIDVPGVIDNEKEIYKILRSIEVLKQGQIMTDDADYVHIDHLNIWVIMKRMPQTKYIDSDKWKIWTINDLYELVEVNVNQ